MKTIHTLPDVKSFCCALLTALAATGMLMAQEIQMPPAFPPLVPNNTNGVDYSWYYSAPCKAVYTFDDVSSIPCAVAWDNGGTAAEKTEEQSQVGTNFTERGFAEKLEIFRSGDACEGDEKGTISYESQSMTGPPRTLSNFSGYSNFYNDYDWSLRCDTNITTVADTNGHWSITCTVSVKPCDLFFYCKDVLCDCNILAGYTVLFGLSWSAYATISVHIDPGYTIPVSAGGSQPSSFNAYAFLSANGVVGLSDINGFGPNPGTLSVDHVNGTSLSSGNHGPDVQIVSPFDQAELTTASGDVDFTVAAQDPDGSITGLSLYEGSTLLGAATNNGNGFYTFTWTGASTGLHTITAKATDDSSTVTTSSPVSITVESSYANRKPVVSIIKPLGSSTNSALCEFDIYAIDPDGVVTNVAIYDGASLIGRAIAADGNVYSFTWDSSSPGTHTITIKTSDNSGAITTNIETIALLAPPTIDTTFVPEVDDAIRDVAVQADGKILIIGDFGGIGLFDSYDHVARLNADGTTDESFDPGTVASDYLSDTVNCVAVDSLHRVYLGGGGRIVRLDSSGALDVMQSPHAGTNFVIDVDLEVYAFAGGGNEIQLDTYPTETPLYTGGTFSSIEGISLPCSGDIGINSNWDGVVGHVMYGNAGLENGCTVRALCNTSDGLLAGGDVVSDYSWDDFGSPDYGIAWAYLNTKNFLGGNDMYTLAIAQEWWGGQTDGKILAAGDNWYGGGVFVRFNISGTLDTNFNPSVSSDIYSLLVLHNGEGKILAAGEFGLKRFNTDGSTDTNFVVSVNGPIYKLVQQPDGQIIAVGNFSNFGGMTCGNIVRFTP